MAKWAITEYGGVFHITADEQEITTETSNERAVMLLAYFLAAERNYLGPGEE